jgi:lipopolysaccharide transport system ATP-binding protein
MMPVIAVHNLGKAYKQYPNKWARLLEWVLPYANQRHHLHWVLKDIAFELQPGEALGIIGVNGAGKSTLLKMLTGITQATTGSIAIRGRVAALLELGMGFHPDFSGRQNVLISGQLLGYTAAQIEALMPEIEAFAGIGDYIDQPVRVYSSGMQVRLAFSIATAIRPDILIIDEALSVGDTEFQHRSYDRIRRFREQGTSLLFVSHDKGIIINLCDRAILLDQGRLAKEGDPETVMDYYNAMLAEQPKQIIAQTLGEDGKIQTQSGSGEVTLLEASICSQDGKAIELAKVGQTVCIRLRTTCVEAIPSLVAGFMIKDRLGQVMYGTNTFHHEQQLHDLKAGDRCTFSFTLGLGIGPGAYSVSVALHADDSHIAKNYLWLDRVFFFTVVNGDEPVFVGASYLPTQVEVQYDAA